MHQQAIEVDHHGQTLRGMSYRPARTGRFPTVLMLHGFTGNRIEAGFLFVQLGRALAARGVAAVAFDFLHSGESDGWFDQMLVTGELADALHMTRWAQAQPFVDRSRLGVLGFSLGGMLACCASARMADAYKARVLLAPTTTQNMCRHAGRNLEGRTPETWCDPAGEDVTIGPHRLHPRFFEDLQGLDPVADAALCNAPTLLVQGTGDSAVPPTVSQEILGAMQRAGAPCQHELIEGADHAFSRPEWRTRLLEAVTGYLAARL